MAARAGVEPTTLRLKEMMEPVRCCWSQWSRDWCSMFFRTGFRADGGISWAALGHGHCPAPPELRHRGSYSFQHQHFPEPQGEGRWTEISHRNHNRYYYHSWSYSLYNQFLANTKKNRENMDNDTRETEERLFRRETEEIIITTQRETDNKERTNRSRRNNVNG